MYIAWFIRFQYVYLSPECRFPISYLKKYIEPFLPSVIMLTLVTPLFSGWITNKSLEELFVALKGIPAAAPLIVVFLGLFIWLKKED